MLLCVGKFFGTTEEDKKIWQEYKNGNSNGTIELFYNADHSTTHY
jgi:hypothetical protein